MLKRFLSITVILCLLFLTGCWNYREIDDLTIVVGIAIDKTENGEGFHLTYEVEDDSGGDGGGAATVTSKILESEGVTIYDAARNATAKLPGKLYWSNCQLVIISDELARTGIAEILDWFIRKYELRLTLVVVISKEKSAKDLLNCNQSSEENSSDIISFLTRFSLENNPRNLSTTNTIELYKIYGLLGSERHSLTLPALKITGEENEKSLTIDGIAVFYKDRLLGYIDPLDTFFFNFATDNIQGGLITITEEYGLTGNVTLEVMKSKTKITPVINESSAKIKIDTQTIVSISEINTHTNYIDEHGRKILQNATEQYLEENILRVVERTKKYYRADIFGFGDAIYRAKPDFMNKFEQSWSDMYRKLPVLVNSKIIIKSSELSKTPVRVGD